MLAAAAAAHSTSYIDLSQIKEQQNKLRQIVLLEAMLSE